MRLVDAPNYLYSRRLQRYRACHKCGTQEAVPYSPDRIYAMALQEAVMYDLQLQDKVPRQIFPESLSGEPSRLSVLSVMDQKTKDKYWHDAYKVVIEGLEKKKRHTEEYAAFAREQDASYKNSYERASAELVNMEAKLRELDTKALRMIAEKDGVIKDNEKELQELRTEKETYWQEMNRLASVHNKSLDQHNKVVEELSEKIKALQQDLDLTNKAYVQAVQQREQYHLEVMTKHCGCCDRQEEEIKELKESLRMACCDKHLPQLTPVTAEELATLKPCTE